MRNNAFSAPAENLVVAIIPMTRDVIADNPRTTFSSPEARGLFSGPAAAAACDSPALKTRGFVGRHAAGLPFTQRCKGGAAGQATRRISRPFS